MTILDDVRAIEREAIAHMQERAAWYAKQARKWRWRILGLTRFDWEARAYAEHKLAENESMAEALYDTARKHMEANNAHEILS